MAKQASRTELSSPDLSSSSSEDRQQQRPLNVGSTVDSIKNYVNDVLHIHGRDDEQPANLTQTEIHIDTAPGTRRSYENVSAFRQYHSNAEGTAKTNAQQGQDEDLTSDEDDLRQRPPTEQVKKRYH
jgi:hypothetical protein